MKRLNLSLAFLFALILAIVTTRNTQAGRPNPPALSGTVPVTLFVTAPGGTNAVPVPPRVLVIDEHGKQAADLETTLEGVTGTFYIPLKKAGSYVVVGYYPEPNRMATTAQIVDVSRKQTSSVDLAWPAQ